MLTCTFLKVSKISFSLSSSLDCINLRGKGTFGGMGLEGIEFEPTLPNLGGVGALEGYGRDFSSLAVAVSIPSSSGSSCSSSFLALFGHFEIGSNLFTTSQGDSFSRLKTSLWVDEVGSFPSSLNYPMNSAICPICFLASPISLA